MVHSLPFPPRQYFIAASRGLVAAVARRCRGHWDGNKPWSGYGGQFMKMPWVIYCGRLGRHEYFRKKRNTKKCAVYEGSD